MFTLCLVCVCVTKMNECISCVGYVRIISMVAAFYYCFDAPMLAAVFYIVSQGLDAVDGVTARYFKQCSSFGAVLDMLTDRLVE